MNRPLLFVSTGVGLVVIAAVVYVTSSQPDSEVAEYSSSTVTSETKTTSQPQSAEASNAQPGTYVAYSEQAITETKGTKLLFFHAPWCPQCRSIEASINKDGIPSGVTVFKVDYDSNQSLRQKYGVKLQTTFVKVDDQGNKLDLYVAYEEPEFSSVRRNLLE